MKRLSVPVPLVVRIGPDATGNGRVQQHIALHVIGKQVRVAVPPLAVAFSEFRKRCGLSFALNQRRSSLHQCLNAVNVLRARRALLCGCWTDDENSSERKAEPEVFQHRQPPGSELKKKIPSVNLASRVVQGNILK